MPSVLVIITLISLRGYQEPKVSEIDRVGAFAGQGSGLETLRTQSSGVDTLRTPQGWANWLEEQQRIAWAYAIAATLLQVIVSGILLWYIHFENRKLQQAIAINSIQRGFEDKYIELVYVLEPNVGKDGHLSHSAYAKKYWTHQFYQWLQWMRGNLDATTFEYWMRHRRREYHSGEREVGGKPYRTILDEGLREPLSETFKDFIYAVVKEDIGRAIKSRKRWKRRFRKENLSADGQQSKP